MNTVYKKKPEWLKVKLPNAREYSQMRMYLSKYNLHTICESGSCPNLGECWNAGTATFMILGDICTRSCRFCNVKTGKPNPPDDNEPINIALAIQEMGLKHCVITSVDRDDLDDKGANHWKKTIISIKEKNPHVTIEALVPDFSGILELLEIVANTKPDVISHNLETVERLTPIVRSAASYSTSLKVIEFFSKYGLTTKSGLMLGLGEKENEVLSSMDDLMNVGCQILTLGQYLQPTKDHLPVVEYIPPSKFEYYKLVAIEKGFKFVESAPLVRSSYHAERHV